MKPARCEREHCGGSHTAGFQGCMLCGDETIRQAVGLVFELSEVVVANPPPMSVPSIII